MKLSREDILDYYGLNISNELFGLFKNNEEHSSNKNILINISNMPSSWIILSHFYNKQHIEKIVNIYKQMGNDNAPLMDEILNIRKNNGWAEDKVKEAPILKRSNELRMKWMKLYQPLFDYTKSFVSKYKIKLKDNNSLSDVYALTTSPSGNIIFCSYNIKDGNIDKHVNEDIKNSLNNLDKNIVLNVLDNLLKNKNNIILRNTLIDKSLDSLNKQCKKYDNSDVEYEGAIEEIYDTAYNLTTQCSKLEAINAYSSSNEEIIKAENEIWDKCLKYYNSLK